ncbi:unnamed protein product, partial [Ectocarpus sp. 12 AP-2014]
MRRFIAAFAQGPEKEMMRRRIGIEEGLYTYSRPTRSEKTFLVSSFLTRILMSKGARPNVQRCNDVHFRPSSSLRNFRAQSCLQQIIRPATATAYTRTHADHEPRLMEYGQECSSICVVYSTRQAPLQGVWRLYLRGAMQQAMANVMCVTLLSLQLNARKCAG